MQPRLTGLEGTALMHKHVAWYLEGLRLPTQRKSLALLLRHLARLCSAPAKTGMFWAPASEGELPFPNVQQERRNTPPLPTQQQRSNPATQMQTCEHNNIWNGWVDSRCPKCTKCRFWCVDRKYSAVSFWKTKLPAAATWFEEGTIFKWRSKSLKAYQWKTGIIPRTENVCKAVSGLRVLYGHIGKTFSADHRRVVPKVPCSLL